jgi:hypothetical protein
MSGRQGEKQKSLPPACRAARFLIYAFFATVLFCGATNAQEFGTGIRNLAWAQEFLQTVYPNLTDHRYVITAVTSHSFDAPDMSMGNLAVQIGEMAPGTTLGTGSKTGPIYATQFVSSFFTFDKDGHLSSFASEGPAVGNPQDYSNVKQLVESHPEWTDAQDVSALIKAGAEYGPEEKSKFLNTVPIERLEKLFGKVNIVSSEFVVATGSEQRLPVLHWIAMAKVTFTNGDQSTYRMQFEPFKGALIGMDKLRTTVK